MGVDRRADGHASSPALVGSATAGIVVLAYNLPGIGGQLRLSREVYADIFLRKIDKWNDPRLQAINPTLNLPIEASPSRPVRTAAARRSPSRTT